MQLLIATYNVLNMHAHIHFHNYSVCIVFASKVIYHTREVNCTDSDFLPTVR